MRRCFPKERRTRTRHLQRSHGVHLFVCTGTDSAAPVFGLNFKSLFQLTTINCHHHCPFPYSASQQMLLIIVSIKSQEFQNRAFLGDVALVSNLPTLYCQKKGLHQKRKHNQINFIFPIKFPVRLDVLITPILGIFFSYSSFEIQT